jgi:hypothetical protein
VDLIESSRPIDDRVLSPIRTDNDIHVANV